MARQSFSSLSSRRFVHALCRWRRTLALPFSRLSRLGRHTCARRCSPCWLHSLFLFSRSLSRTLIAAHRCTAGQFCKKKNLCADTRSLWTHLQHPDLFGLYLVCMYPELLLFYLRCLLLSNYIRLCDFLPLCLVGIVHSGSVVGFLSYSSVDKPQVEFKALGVDWWLPDTTEWSYVVPSSSRSTRSRSPEVH
ncbi:hypothetical protein C8R47DRAFT_1108968 [Mycena vitilis]|nr:hypothetical protein C8R47DRAFT_1108968 [Mycena vitilis]